MSSGGMKMKRTGLPYDMDDMDEIKNKLNEKGYEI